MKKRTAAFLICAAMMTAMSVTAGATAEDGKLVVGCDGDGKVDFGQINFYQDKAQGHNDGDKEFHYTINRLKQCVKNNTIPQTIKDFFLALATNCD